MSHFIYLHKLFLTTTITLINIISNFIRNNPNKIEPNIPHINLEIDPYSSNGDDEPYQEIFYVRYLPILSMLI